jgi:ABC-2 type transport system permease protein
VNLSHRRDLGTGLVPPRPGRARAAPALGRPLGLATRLQRGSLIGWSAGLAVLALAYGWITDSINAFVKDNQTLTDLIAAQGRGTLVEQYVAMSFRILALVAAGFAIQSVLRVRGEETATHAEQVLATPVSRVRFAASHLVLAFGGTLAVLVLTGVTFGVSDALVTNDAGALGQALVASIIFVPAVWMLGALTFALVGLLPRAAAAAWGVLAVCFVIGMFGQLLKLSHWVQDVSPFQHVPTYPATGLDAVPIVALVAITAALTALGLAGLQRRDIG